MPWSIRLFVAVPLHEGAEVPGTPAQAHYLGNVMRRAVGDVVHVFDGVHGEWEARVTGLRRERLTLRAERLVRPQTAEPDIWLLFAPLKRDATDLVIEKATELGVAQIVPVLTARTNATRLNADRLRAIAAEAAEQCERLTVPTIAPARDMAAVLATWPPGRPLVVALERSAAPMLPARRGPSALLVGPEGGFTPAELDALRRHLFVVQASLGPRILRAETAVIAGLALLQAAAAG
jgi:16S rRNA (uracil1498-N3)-methyltransferase